MFKKLFGGSREKVTLTLHAPLSGRVVPLDQVPDPVFSSKIAGDGFAIDPESNELLSPVDGKISRLVSTNHAVGITTDNGLELLLHIGIETVQLKGEGFHPKVAEGQRIRKGDVLIEFDREAIQPRIPSMLTPVLVANTDQIDQINLKSGSQVKAGDELFTVTLKS